MIPLGLVRDTHFSLRVPKYLNVGSLGLTLAHEMLHSLDTTGRQFDHRGRLTSDFWDSRSRKNFANVSECVVKQYQNHFKRPLRIDSRTIMLEVIIKWNLIFHRCKFNLDIFVLVFKNYIYNGYFLGWWRLYVKWKYLRYWRHEYSGKCVRGAIWVRRNNGSYWRSSLSAK